MFLVMAAVSPMILFANVLESGYGIALIANALAVAFVLCALIEIFGPVSGAHFNPLVTMMMVFEKKIRIAKAAAFVLCQFAGGIAGTAASRIMFFHEAGAVLAISQNVRNEYVFFGEVFGTFILVLAVLMLAKAGSTKTPIVIGFLVGGQAMATSSTMFANPQVTVARMLTTTPAGIRPADGAVFIIVQFSGALLAYAMYRILKEKRK